jgi:hypothetical protein
MTYSMSIVWGPAGMAVSVDHLRRTLSHPLLDTLFKEFCLEDREENMALQFWLAVEEFRSILDSVWLRIRANSIFNEYLGEKQLQVRENTFFTLNSRMRNNRFNSKMFDTSQEEIFEFPLSNAVRRFLQSDLYHEQYDKLRRALLFVNLNDAAGFQAAHGGLTCSIAYGDQQETSVTTSSQKCTWVDDDEIHKLEILASKTTDLRLDLFVRNDSCWKEDHLVGTVTIPSVSIWDEKPAQIWYSLEGTSEEFQAAQIQVGVLMVHRPFPGISVGELNFSNPLATSCSYGHYSAVRALLASGHPIDDRVAESNRTSLQVAVIKNRGKIVQLLLNQQADPDTVDSHSQTAMHLAAQFAPHLCHMLVSAGARVDTKELFQNGQTSLHMLATHNYTEALEFLVEKGANIDSVTLDGITPLHKAVEQGNIESVRILLKNRAKTNLKDEEGVTALALAEKLGNKSPARAEILQMMKTPLQ